MIYICILISESLKLHNKLKFYEDIGTTRKYKKSIIFV
jgi:hypothetical protein